MEKIDGKVKIAVSTRALFNLEKENEIFEKEGAAAYEEWQTKHEKDVLATGPAFPLIKALSAMTDEVEIFVVSKATANISLRIFNSTKHYGLKNITRGFFTGGESLVPYLKAFDVDLYLTMSPESAKQAVDAGIPAAALISGHNYDAETDCVRVAFDADAVLFSDEAEAVFQEGGLEAFNESEERMANKELSSGPMAKFLKALAKLQKSNGEMVRTAIVTARSAPAHERVIKTLMKWGIRVNEICYLGGLDKAPVLENFKPLIFFDDKHYYTMSASRFVPAGTVPYVAGSKLETMKEVK